jgi:aminopeptidase N
MISIPSEKYIGEQMEVIDVDAIHAVREFVMTEIAKQLQSLFLELYHKYHDVSSHYVFSAVDIGKHQLKNRCLIYLMLLPEYENLGIQQFDTALKVNMSDTRSALVALSNIHSPARENALERFYSTWKDDALVVDKWLAIQAGSKAPNTLQTIKKLMRHEAFDIKNPNKVYSLIGTFGHHNPIHFHAKDGEGYAFLREVVHKLDQLNPQVAGRMVKPLTSWRRYDIERQKLMQKQLELLLQSNPISKDLYEIVTKSLGEI